MKLFYAVTINSLSPGFCVIEEIPGHTRAEAYHDFECHNNDHFILLDEEQFSSLQIAMKKYTPITK